jgi:hypothetical protein
MTAPAQVAYDDVLRVWRGADGIPQIEHAWLFDHRMLLGSNPNGPAFEGWTLLSALAGQTERLRLGVMVTSNRFRPPAMLAKIAATVDVISGGRLEFGIGAGSRPDVPMARREYAAHGLPFHDAAHAVKASPTRARSSADCGPIPRRSTSRPHSAAPNPSSDPTRRS